MKLTNREKILLPAALLLIVIALFINFITLPLFKDINKIKTQTQELDTQLAEAKAKQVEVDKLKVEIEKMQANSIENTDGILQIWDQAELLYTIEDIIDPYCKKKSIDFFNIPSIGSVQAGGVSISINTNYDDLKKLLKALEQAKYFNTITLFDVKKSELGLVADAEEDNLEVSMNLSFYSQNMATEYPETYNFMNGKYGKENLFGN